MTLAVTAAPDSADAAGACKAYTVILGQEPLMTGPTDTDWFNIIGEGFSPVALVTISFDVPVIPWSMGNPATVEPAVMSYTIPAASVSTGFKRTFRNRDPGIQVVNVRTAGAGCQTSSLVDFAPPATSIAEELPAPRGDGPLRSALLLLLAFGGGLLAARRRFRGPDRTTG